MKKVTCPKCHSEEFAVYGEGTVQELIEKVLDSGKYFFGVTCKCVCCGQEFSLVFQLIHIFEAVEK